MTYKIGGTILALLLAGLAGFYLGRGQKEVTTVEVRGETRVEYRDRIVTVTKTVQPDGTVTETTITVDRAGSTDSTTTDKSNSTRSLASNYSLGLKYWAKYSDLLDSSWGEKIEVSASRRLVGEFWLDLGVRKQEAALGVSFKF